MEIELDRIVDQCKSNNHKAFEIVYKKYYRILLGVALRYSGNMQEAEDVLQDSFIKIFNSIKSYNNKGSFEGWMKRVVQNTAINNYRDRVKYDIYIDEFDKEDALTHESINTVFESFNENDIITLLNSMPEGYRLAINLYFIDGYSHSEISEMLKITIGTSKSQLYKAKNYLKNLIEINNQAKIV